MPDTSPASKDPPVHALGRAFRSRNYLLYFCGQGVSLVGTWIQSTTMSWLVYRLTGSPALLGVVAFAGQVPAFALAPVAGVVTDRWPRRTALLVTQGCAMAQAGVLGWLTFSGLIQVWHLVALAAFQGAVNAFDITLRQAFVTQLVSEPADLGNAIALNSSLMNATRLVGPSLAGLIIPVVGEAACFFINSASYLAVIAALFALELAPRPAAPGSQRMAGDIAAGFRYAFGVPAIRAVLLLLAVISFAGMPYVVLMPVFARDVLHGGPRELGFLIASSGLGALVAGLHLASRTGVEGLSRFVTRGAAAFGLALVGFSLSRSFPLSLCTLAVAGYAMMTSATACNTIIQTLVDDAMRGRVMSLYLMAFMGLTPLGALLMGVLADHTGAPAALASGGVACIMGGLFFGRRLEATALPPPRAAC